MKWKPATWHAFIALHSWVGMLAGMLLFVAFYAGAFTVFQPALQQWATPAPDAVGTAADMQRLLDESLARHPEANKHLGMTFPGYLLPAPSAYWQDRHGTWQFATPHRLDGSPARPTAELPELINDLHYSLGFPGAGTLLMGVVSLLYGIALVSGVVIYLPEFAKDVFALRRGRNLKRFWRDVHSAFAALCLPFHAVFAVTGALLCLLAVLMLALGPLAYRGGLMAASGAAMDTAPIRAASGVARPLLPVAAWVAQAEAVARANGLPGFVPQYLKLANAGDANATVELTGAVPRTVGAGVIALDAATAAPLAVQLPGHRDTNHATLAWVYALHYGSYGNVVVQWLYLLLGLGGAALFYAGNLLWIESRRRRRAAVQPRSAQVMARTTVGVCIGLCVAVSAAALAAQLLPRSNVELSGGERWVCFATWAACVLWAAWRAPIHAARELLWLAAALTAALPIAHGLATGGWPWHSLASGQLAVFAVDVGALALAAVFSTLAHAAGRRARDGEGNSVWAG